MNLDRKVIPIFNLEKKGTWFDFLDLICGERHTCRPKLFLTLILLKLLMTQACKIESSLSLFFLLLPLQQYPQFGVYATKIILTEAPSKISGNDKKMKSRKQKLSLHLIQSISQGIIYIVLALGGILILHCIFPPITAPMRRNSQVRHINVNKELTLCLIHHCCFSIKKFYAEILMQKFT